MYDQWRDLASQPSKALKVFPSFISSLEHPDILWNHSHYSSEIKNWLIQDISDNLRSQAPLYPKVVEVYSLITIVPFSERFFPFVIERWLQQPQDHAFHKKSTSVPFPKVVRNISRYLNGIGLVICLSLNQSLWTEEYEALCGQDWLRHHSWGEVEGNSIGTIYSESGKWWIPK